MAESMGDSVVVQAADIVRNCKGVQEQFKASKRERRFLADFLGLWGGVLDQLQQEAQLQADAGAILREADVAVQRGHGKLAKHQQRSRVQSALKVTNDAATCREIGEELFGLLLLLICVAVPRCSSGVQAAMDAMRVGLSTSAAQHASQLERCVRRLQALQGTSLYDLKPELDKLSGLVSELQDDGDARRQWHAVNDVIIGNTCELLPGELRKGLQPALQAMMGMMKEHARIPEPPHVKADIPWSEFGVLSALQEGDTHWVQALSCPVEGIMYGLIGASVPVALNACGCDMSKLAAHKHAVACPLCLTPAGTGSRYTENVQIKRLLQAVTEVQTMDAREVTLLTGEPGGVLAAGGQADVVLGTYRGRRVAIKRMHVNYLDRPFVRDLWKLIGVSHIAGGVGEQVCSLLGVCWLPGVVWLVHELCDGSLAEAVQRAVAARGPGLGLPAVDVALLLLEISTACCMLFSKAKILHRDICPENILLKQGRPCLIDFGIAAEASTVVSTATRVKPGRVNYVPPERGRLGQRPSPKSDVYGLAATAVFAASGEHPYAAAEVEGVWVKAFIGESPMVIPEHLPDVLQRLLRDMSALEPEDRAPMEEVHARSRAVVAQLAASHTSEYLQPTWPGSLGAVEGTATTAANGSADASGHLDADKDAAHAMDMDFADAPIETGLDAHALNLSEDDQLIMKRLVGGNIHPLLSLTGHLDYVYSVAWSPDGAHLATASWDSSALIWGADSGEVVCDLSVHETAYVRCVAWSPDSTRLAVASNNKNATVWDMTKGAQAMELQDGHNGPIRCIAWSPDGSQLATASWDSRAAVWDARTGACMLKLAGHEDELRSVAWSPDGRFLATASEDSTAAVWDAESGQCVRVLRGHGDAVACVTWSPDGRRLATSSADNTAVVWDVATGRCVAEMDGHDSYVSCIAWSPDGAHVATASWDKTAAVWDANSGDLVLELTGHTSTVYSVAWSPDGMQLATASWDKTAKVWTIFE